MMKRYSGWQCWGGLGQGAPWVWAPFMARVIALLTLAFAGCGRCAQGAGTGPAQSGTAPPQSFQEQSEKPGTCLIGPPSPWVKVDAVPAESKALAKDASGGVIHLFRDEQVNVGTGESFHRTAVSILNEVGLQSASQLSIPFDPSYQALALHHVNIRRGSATIGQLRPEAVRIIERESEIDRYVMNGQATALIVVSDLRFGDVLDYAFSVRGRNPVFGDRYVNTVLLGSPAPLARFRYRMIVPGGRRVNFKVHDIEWPPIIAEAPGGTEYTWSRDGIPGTPPELNAPAGYISMPWLELSEFQSWQEVASWAQQTLDPASVLRPRPIPMPFQPASAPAEQIVQFVQDEIRYLALTMGPSSHRPYPPDVVATRRYGDCKDKSVFLCLLLRASGIEAMPALVNTFMRERINERLPSPLAFDHVIVRAVAGGKECWIDPTISSQGGPLQRRPIGPFRRALVVGGRTGGLVEIPAAATPPGRILVEENYVATNAATPARLMLAASYFDSEADGMRASLASLNEDELRRQFAGYYSAQYPELRQAESLGMADDRANNRITVRESYEIDGYWKTNAVDTRLMGSLGSSWICGFLQVPADPHRRAPFALPYPRSVTTTSMVLLPDGFQIAPSDRALDNQWFRFKSRIDFSTNVVSLACHIETKCDSVAPDKIREYRDAVAAITESSSYNLTWNPLLSASGGAKSKHKIRWLLGGLIAVAIAIAVALALYFFDPEPPHLRGLDRDLGMAGIGGWLLPFAVGLAFRPLMKLWAAITFFNLGDTIRVGPLINPESPSYNPTMEGLAFIYYLYQVANIPLSFLLLVLFFKMRSSFRPVMVACASLDIAAIWCQISVWHFIPVVNNLQEAGRATSHTITGAMWIGYLLMSRRSRNTFRRRRHRRTHHGSGGETPHVIPSPTAPPQPIGALPPRRVLPGTLMPGSPGPPAPHI